MIGSEVGDARELEETIWGWIAAAELEESPKCSKGRRPRDRCEACGPLFPRLGGASPEFVRPLSFGSFAKGESHTGIMAGRLGDRPARCEGAEQ